VVWVDIVIPGIIVVSALISLMRGFVREALSLVGWLAAFWIALTFADDLANLFLAGISVPSIRIIVAFTILFVVTLVIMAIINNLARQLIKKSGLKGTDRMIGMTQDLWWKESVMIDVFHEFAVWLQQLVAPEIKGRQLFW
jgi:membrane protein required for colicin V production